MNRNSCTLEFQRRLIRTALQSPRAECMNLLGIVYSNLEEFIVDRLPFDKDLDRTMDRLSEVFYMLEMAVAKKFFNLYVENLPENWETAYDLLFGENENDLQAITAKRVEYAQFVSDHDAPGVFIADGQKFISKAFLTPLLDSGDRTLDGDVDQLTAKAVADSCRYTLSTDGVRLKRNIRNAAGPNGAERVVTTYVDAINSRRLRNICVHFIIRNHQNTNPTVRAFATAQEIINGRNAIPQESSKASNFTYRIAFDNPIMLHFDKVAAMILRAYSGSPMYRHVTFKPDTAAFSKLRGTVEPVERSYMEVDRAFVKTGYTAWSTKLYRGPFKDDYFMMELCRNLRISPEDLMERETIDGVEALASTYDDFMTDAWLTIYRTDNIEDFSKSINLKLLFFLAAMLGKHMHILIECRAHRDEANNVKLYQMLSEYGVDIRAGIPSHTRFYAGLQTGRIKNCEYGKVHAKVWAFTFSTPSTVDGTTTVELFSTGNFTTMAQRTFVDSFLLIRRRPAKIISGDMFETIFNSEPRDINETKPQDDPLGVGMSIKAPNIQRVDDEKFIFSRNMIRPTLLNQIRMTRRVAIYDSANLERPLAEHRPAIFFKVNHITDETIISALCSAADAGVDVQICARTTCTIPINAGFRNIRVNSICGKYLEHDRWFIFGYLDSANEFHPKTCYISSADLMPRNLDNRMEYMYRIDEPEGMSEIVSRIRTYCNLKTAPSIGYFNYELNP